jgi:SAM-dependent methyltransferase
LGVILVITALAVGYQGIYTLRVLDSVERSRDHWQQPAEIIEQLKLKEGSVVADIGSGAGYFTLKIAPMVGERGVVYAVDILKEPLAFLWIRALLRYQSNIHIIHGELDNPDLPEGQIDAVLIANAYHEFHHPRTILNHVLHALREGGRIVLVDRGPLSVGEASGELKEGRHEVPCSAVEKDLRDTGFDLVTSNQRFIDMPAAERPGDRPDTHPWWIIVARKP